MNTIAAPCLVTRADQVVLRSRHFDHRGNSLDVHTIFTGNTALAVVKLVAAGKFSVHVSQFKRDALARLEQARVQYKCFSSLKRGTGNSECWAMLGDGFANVDYSIVSEMPAVAE